MNKRSAPIKPAAGGQRLGWIEAGRAVAALAVALFHSNPILQAHAAAAPRFSAFSLGERGVDFFFVLSGFIICYVHLDDVGRGPRVGYFVWRRFLRIYPLLWLIVGADVAHSVIIDHQRHNPAQLWTSMSLWPSLLWPTPSVVWTLRHEILFYAVFAMVIASRRIGAAIALACLAATVAQAIMLASGHSLPGLQAMVFTPLNLQFAAGCLAAWMARRFGHAPGHATLFLGLALLIGMLLATWAMQLPERPVLDYRSAISLWRDLAYAPIFALVVHGLAGISRTVSTPRWILLLGRSSYALYLSHPLAMSVAAIVIAKALPVSVLTNGLGHIALIGAAVATGIALHVLFERPFAHWAARIVMDRKAPSSVPA